MPPLNEGDLMYMPVTDPAISIDQARVIMSREDEILKGFPEVEWAVGKAGRADTSTDPAPVNMNETIVHLKSTEQWRAGLTRESLIAEMDEKLRPARCDQHLDPADQKSHRHALDGDSLASGHQDIRQRSEDAGRVVAARRGCRALGARRERRLPRTDQRRALHRHQNQSTAAARYGVDARTIEDAIEKGIGETNLSVTIEGRRRFPVRVRYGAEFRGSREALAQIPIGSATGPPIPLAQLADISEVQGPTMISSENGLLRARCS